METERVSYNTVIERPLRSIITPSRITAQRKLSFQNFDLVIQRCHGIIDFYRGLGFALEFTKPEIVDEQPLAFLRRYRALKAVGLELFGLPPSCLVSHEAFMEAIGREQHWTMTDAAWVSIGWNRTEEWTWFLSEVSTDCPRLNTTYPDIVRNTTLPTIEQYHALWYQTAALDGRKLDPCTVSYLATSYGNSGVLSASGITGSVAVGEFSAKELQESRNQTGGREITIIK